MTRTSRSFELLKIVGCRREQCTLIENRPQLARIKIIGQIGCISGINIGIGEEQIRRDFARQWGRKRCLFCRTVRGAWAIPIE